MVALLLTGESHRAAHRSITMCRSICTAGGRKWFWKGCKPIFVCALAGGENHLSQQPIPETCPANGTRSGQLLGFLFGLAPDGVFRASALTLGAVGSYPTFSPLPTFALSSGGRRFIFCGTIRRHASRHGLPRVSQSPPSCVGGYRLRGIAPYGVRTFLPRLAPEAILRPSKITRNIPPW